MHSRFFFVLALFIVAKTIPRCTSIWDFHCAFQSLLILSNLKSDPSSDLFSIKDVSKNCLSSLWVSLLVSATHKLFVNISYILTNLGHSSFFLSSRSWVSSQISLMKCSEHRVTCYSLPPHMLQSVITFALPASEAPRLLDFVWKTNKGLPGISTVSWNKTCAETFTCDSDWFPH